jgi:putative ABC transport system permease protein
VLLARRNLLRDRTRFALSALGVGLAIMLILLLAGFEAGLYRQLAGYLERTPGSLVVAQASVAETLAVTSVLSPGTLARIERTEGVGRAMPVIAQFVIADLHDRKQPAYLVGYDPERGGGPWQLAAGREPRSHDEVVVDQILADRHELAVSDSLELMGRRLRVVGLSSGTSSWMTSFLFVRSSAAEALLRAPGALSHVFVTPAAGVGLDVLASRLRGIAGVEVTLKEVVIDNDRQLLTRVFAAPVRLMTGIAFVVGTLVVGLILYTATVERRREYGVLKAIGGRNRVLYNVTVTQAIVVALAGASAGVALTLAAGRLVVALRPEFLVAVELPAVALALGAALAMALVAALVPARLLAGLAPADVFRRGR